MVNVTQPGEGEQSAQGEAIADLGVPPRRVLEGVLQQIQRLLVATFEESRDDGEADDGVRGVGEAREPVVDGRPWLTSSAGPGRRCSTMPGIV